MYFEFFHEFHSLLRFSKNPIHIFFYNFFGWNTIPVQIQICELWNILDRNIMLFLVMIGKQKLTFVKNWKGSVKDNTYPGLSHIRIKSHSAILSCLTFRRSSSGNCHNFFFNYDCFFIQCIRVLHSHSCQSQRLHLWQSFANFWTPIQLCLSSRVGREDREGNKKKTDDWNCTCASFLWKPDFLADTG